MKLDDFELLRRREVKTTIRETSVDPSKDATKYMTACEKIVVNFDLVKRKYLNDIGLSEEMIESTIRFSLSENNTEEEVDYVITSIGELLPMLRHYTRG